VVFWHRNSTFGSKNDFSLFLTLYVLSRFILPKFYQFCQNLTENVFTFKNEWAEMKLKRSTFERFVSQVGAHVPKTKRNYEIHTTRISELFQFTPLPFNLRHGFNSFENHVGSMCRKKKSALIAGCLK
jgi:hypothetical protein